MSYKTEKAQKQLEKAKRAERYQESNADWNKMVIFPAVELEPRLGLLKKTCNSNHPLPFFITHPTGLVEQMTGVFSVVKNLSGELLGTPPEYRGWLPFIVERTSNGFHYFQAHPLDVITAHGQLMYAPWANPQLAKAYRTKCKQMFPSKAYVFEMNGVNGDFENDFKFFISAIEGMAGPRRDRNLTVMKLGDLWEERKAQKEKAVADLLSLFTGYAKDSVASAILFVKSVEGSTDGDVEFVIGPDKERIEQLFGKGACPFAFLRVVHKEGPNGRYIEGEGNLLLTAQVESNKEWFETALQLAMNDFYETIGDYYVSKGVCEERARAVNPDEN